MIPVLPVDQQLLDLSTIEIVLGVPVEDPDAPEILKNPKLTPLALEELFTAIQEFTPTQIFLGKKKLYYQVFLWITP